MFLLVFLMLAVPRCADGASHFITFATASHRDAAARNAASAKAPGGFDEAAVLSPDYFEETFKTRYAHILQAPRGAGYWSWKPYVISKYMYYNASENDLVCYNDASYEVKQPFASYLSAALAGRACKILAFTSKPSEGRFPERSWSKRDAFVLMNIPSEANYTQTSQIWGGFLCFIKTFDSAQFLFEWLTYARDPRIITDAPSEFGAEDPEFRENRHDQTIASLLLKARGCFVDEPFPDSYVYN